MPSPPPAKHNSSTFSGTVSQYLLAPRGEVEGLLLKDGTSVHFPPQLAGLLTAQIKPGDRLTVQAAKEVPASSPQGRGVNATALTPNKTNQTLTSGTEAGNAAPATPNAGRHMEIRGHVVRVLRDGDGLAEGVLLSGGQQVRLAAETAKELARLNENTPGGEVRASGMGVKTEYGTVIDALGLKYDGKELAAPKDDPPSPPAIPGR